MAGIPHCDQKVLHAPGECVYCDAYPEWQQARVVWGIAFTGHSLDDPTLEPCPSELARSVETQELWGGNRPKGYET